jgi:hypothetical protein
MVRSLITGQQDQCRLAVCVVESPFQSREILQQLSPQAADCPVGVGGEVGAASAQYPKIDGSFVTVTDRV